MGESLVRKWQTIRQMILLGFELATFLWAVKHVRPSRRVKTALILIGAMRGRRMV